MAILEHLFLMVLDVSMCSGLAGGLLVLGRRILTGKPIAKLPVASGGMCLCWLLLSLRLLIPVDLPVNMLEIRVPAADIDYQANVAAVSSAYAQGDGAATGASSGISWLSVGVVVWIAGAAVLALLQVIVYCRFRSRMSAWSREPDALLLCTAETLKCELGVRKTFRVLCCDRVRSPMLIGILRPMIFLPPGLDGEQIDAALRHELTHLKRRDILLKAVILSANILHWFNPLVWLMVREAERDIEAACDEAMTAGKSLHQRRRYCEIILDMMSERVPFCVAAFVCRKESMMKRFANIMDTRARTRGILLTVLVLCASVLLGGLVGCSDTDALPADNEKSVSMTDTAQAGEKEAEMQELIEQMETEQEQLQEKIRNYSEKYDSIMDAEAAMDMINQYRKEMNLPELATDNAMLTETAKLRLSEVIEEFSHTRPDGTSFETALKQQGIVYDFCAENLGCGQRTAGQIVTAWATSESHNANLLAEDAKYMCVLAAENEDGISYWIFLICS